MKPRLNVNTGMQEVGCLYDRMNLASLAGLEQVSRQMMLGCTHRCTRLIADQTDVSLTRDQTGKALVTKADTTLEFSQDW